MELPWQLHSALAMDSSPTSLPLILAGLLRDDATILNPKRSLASTGSVPSDQILLTDGLIILAYRNFDLSRVFGNTPASSLK